MMDRVTRWIWRHFDRRLDRIDALQLELKKELKTMSDNLSQKLDDVSAAIEADVAVVAAEVSKLLGEMTPGATVTQAQVDRLTAIDTALKAIPPAP